MAIHKTLRPGIRLYFLACTKHVGQGSYPPFIRLALQRILHVP